MKVERWAPEERATLGAPRSVAAASLAASLAAAVADGYATCSQCRSQRATSVRRLDGAVRAMCPDCSTNSDLDDQIAILKQRARHRR